MRALIVDPSLTVRMDLAEILAGTGFVAFTAAGLDDARSVAARELGVDLLIVDGAQLGEEGAARLRELRREGHDREAPAIVLVGAKEPALALRGDPGVALLPKPYDPRALAERSLALADPDAGPASLLVVDDSLTFAGELRDRLQADGFRVVVARSGEEGLASVASGAFDCVLLDMVMPGIDGAETCRRIRAEARWRSLPIIMLTAREGTAPALEGLQAGADDFFGKSGSLDVLAARVRAQLRRRRWEREAHRMREQLLLEAARGRADRELAETRAKLLAELEAKNAELAAARDAAEEAVRLRDEFMIVATHELKTPVTSLQLQLQSARRSLATPSAPPPLALLREKLDIAVRQTERLASLIDNLLDVSRIDAGKLVLEPEAVDVAQTVRDVARHLESLANAAGCRLEVRAPTAVVGRWDRTRIEQILTNLVTNAVKYGPGRPVELVVDAADGRAVLEVTDHGIGVAPSDAERVFGRFERAVSPRHYGGLGLGLYISRQIAEAHGGTLRVRSTPGQGSVFVLELPIAGPEPRGG